MVVAAGCDGGERSGGRWDCLCVPPECDDEPVAVPSGEGAEGVSGGLRGRRAVELRENGFRVGVAVQSLEELALGSWREWLLSVADTLPGQRPVDSVRGRANLGFKDSVPAFRGWAAVGVLRAVLGDDALLVLECLDVLDAAVLLSVGVRP